MPSAINNEPRSRAARLIIAALCSRRRNQVVRRRGQVTGTEALPDTGDRDAAAQAAENEVAPAPVSGRGAGLQTSVARSTQPAAI
jgi:hypothetical protein